MNISTKKRVCLLNDVVYMNLSLGIEHEDELTSVCKSSIGRVSVLSMDSIFM